MVRLLGAAFVSLVLAFTSPFAPRTLAHSHPLVTMHVATGYGEQYRDAAWVPIRVTLHNVTASNLSGALEIPDSLNNNGQGFQGPPQPFTAQYETPVVLPAGATKQVTLYVPGSDIGGQTHVRFRSNSRVLAESYTQPTSFTDSDASIGALVTDPANMTWLRHVSSSLVTIHTIQLTPATVTPLAEALANFDMIVLTNTDTARLDNDQLVALNRYVRNGGSLILVGGPSWQSTLHSLPSTLLPGKLAGSRTLPNLSGLTTLGAGTPPARPTVVSVLRHPVGTVVASERNVPLVVQEGLGSGQIVYLAFDPAVDPIAHWTSRSNLLTRIITRAAPLAMSRAARPSNFQAPSTFMNPYGPPSDIGSELANVPAAALPSILLFFFLTVLYLVLLGPANFFTLRRLKRRELAWITVPAIALLCVGATFGVAYHLKGNTVLLNTVSVVQLDGNTDQHPASLYVGLFAPVQGDYHLTYHAPALASILPQFQYGGSGPQGHPLGLRFQEGGDTNVTFASMNMWSMRSVALHTWVRFPGGVQTHLHLNARGDIVGTVHNGTQLPLVRPVIMAGDKVTHLRDLPAGSTINVHVRPGYDIHAHNYQPVWYKAYGQPSYGGYMGAKLMALRGLNGGTSISYGGGYSYCCPGPTPAQEKTLAQRIRNTAAMLPDIQTISSLGEVTFAAWSQQPLDALTVDGTVPSRRNLDLLVMPVSVGLPQSSFHLRRGTLGATLVDDSPQQPLSGCCSRPMTQQSIFLGSGGWATFSFSVPHGGRVQFRRLTLSVDAGGADGTNIGHVYDWHAQRWVHVNLHYADARLPNPNRFVSPSGTVLVKLAATDSSRDIGISDPRQALQLSGTGVVG